jgi:hypothetical protein
MQGSKAHVAAAPVALIAKQPAGTAALEIEIEVAAVANAALMAGARVAMREGESL